MKKIILSIAAGVCMTFLVSASGLHNTGSCKASDCICTSHACCSGTVCPCAK